MLNKTGLVLFFPLKQRVGGNGCRPLLTFNFYPNYRILKWISPVRTTTPPSTKAPKIAGIEDPTRTKIIEAKGLEGIVSDTQVQNAPTYRQISSRRYFLVV